MFSHAQVIINPSTEVLELVAHFNAVDLTSGGFYSKHLYYWALPLIYLHTRILSYLIKALKEFTSLFLRIDYGNHIISEHFEEPAFMLKSPEEMLGEDVKQ